MWSGIGLLLRKFECHCYVLTSWVTIVDELRKLECHCCVIDILGYNCWRATKIGVSLLCYWHPCLQLLTRYGNWSVNVVLLTFFVIIVEELRKLECHCCVIDILVYNCWLDTEIGGSLLCYWNPGLQLLTSYGNRSVIVLLLTSWVTIVE
jgi:hypothetical protein